MVDEPPSAPPFSRSSASALAGRDTTGTLLKKVLVQVLLAAEGQDKGFDAAIAELRGQMRQGELKPANLAQLTSATDALGAARRSRAEKVLRGFSACVAQLLLLEPPEEIRKELAEFIRHARKVIARPEEQELLTLRFSRVQGKVLEVFPQSQSAKSGQDQAELDIETLFADDTLQGLPPYSSVADAIENILTDLLVQIRVPEEGVVLRDNARKILGAGLNWYELAALLEQVAELVKVSLNTDQEEFELFLRGLNERLSGLTEDFQGIDTTAKALFGVEESLDNHLREDIQTMADGVSAAKSLDVLKTDVLGSLDAVVKRLDEVTEERECLQKNYQQHIAALSSRVQELEQASVSAEQKIQAQQRRNETDELTSLPNRSAYERRLDIEMERFIRYRQNFCLVVADVDHFKSVNDQYGHLAGDKVLSVVAKTIRKRLRRVDFIARYGGEEFAIILPGTDSEQALALMQDLGAQIRACPFHYNKSPLKITVSFGIAEVAEGDTDESLFVRADQALYEAKANGRDQSVVGMKVA